MNTFILIIIILSLILLVLFTNVNIFITKDEKLHIRLKIGLFFSFRVNVNKLLPNLINNLKDKNINTLLIESKEINSLLKYINIDRISIVEYINILLDTWDINTSFLLNMGNVYIINLLEEHFNKVKDVYYRVGYDTIGGLEIKVDAVLSIRVYKVLKYLLFEHLIYRRKLNEQ